MARRLGMAAIVVVASAFLAACDKCTGGLQDIRLPAPPHACSR